MIALASPAPTSLAPLAKTFLLYSRIRLFWSPLFDSNHYHSSDLLSAFVLHHSQLIHENRCHLILYAPVSHILPIDIINNAKWCYMTFLMMDVLNLLNPVSLHYGIVAMIHIMKEKGVCRLILISIIYII